MTNHSRRDLAPTIQYACTGMVAPGVAFSSHRHGRQFALAGRLTLRAALGQALLQGGRQILVRPRQAGTELVVREDLLCHGRLPRQNDHALNLAERGKPDERASGETVLSPFGVRKVQARGRKALAIEGERPGGRVDFVEALPRPDAGRAHEVGDLNFGDRTACRVEAGPRCRGLQHRACGVKAEPEGGSHRVVYSEPAFGVTALAVSAACLVEV